MTKDERDFIQDNVVNPLLEIVAIFPVDSDLTEVTLDEYQMGLIENLVDDLIFISRDDTDDLDEEDEDYGID